MTDRIQITINGESRFFDNLTSPNRLLEILNIKPTRVAIALNEEILTQEERAQKKIQNGDKIEIIRAVAGG